MIFSPISERSGKVRALYLSIYLLLSLGGLTMLVPFVIMLSGSLEPGTRLATTALFPAYLVDDQALWTRYLQAKYRNRTEVLRMTWGDSSTDLLQPAPPPPANGAELKVWDDFVAANKIPPLLLAVGFCDTRAAVPYYYNRAFQQWLEARYGTVEKLNESLGTVFKSFLTILPPNISLGGSALGDTPFITSFVDYGVKEVPMSRKFTWDAGGYYRAVFLPRVVGPQIAEFNTRYGTSYKSYAEVPFGSTVPAVAADNWTLYVSKVLRPDFVGLTPAGEQHLKKSGLGHDEFIRLSSKPEDLRVTTLDRVYADWAKTNRGLEDARIPQNQLDARAFQEEKGFWRRIFITQNYRYVLDAVLFHGYAFRNTAILVILMVGGTLIVNPLAAYALSRFKMRQTYTILLFFLSTIAFPAEVTMIPVFLQLKEFNLLNTFGALVLPGLANGFSIFLLKGFFDSLPRELYEAAEIDGAGEWTMFWLITMNLSKPILAVKALAAFVGAYGAFFYALILAPDPRMWTIMVYVYQLQQSAGTPVVYASLILTAIPTLLIFIFCQNIILRGIVVPSEK